MEERWNRETSILLLDGEGRWVRKAQRDAALEKRRKAKREKIEELKKHRLWRNRYIDKTKNFQFEYTLDPEIFKNLEDLMESYYATFTRQWRIRKDSLFFPHLTVKLLAAGVRRNWIRKKRFPEFEGLRIDKLTLLALEETLNMYRDERAALKEIPTLRMITQPYSSLKAKAGRLIKMMGRLDTPNFRVGYLAGNQRWAEALCLSWNYPRVWSP